MSRLFSTSNGRRPMVPAPVRQLDNWLLLNYPTIWATRIHLYCWYALLFYGVTSTVFFFLPNDPRSNSTYEIHQSIIGVLAALAIVTWLVYLLRFNTFKRFGKQPTFSMGLQLLTFFFMFAIAAFTILIPPYIEKITADTEFPDDRLTETINQLNYSITILEKENNPIEFIPDTVLFTQTADEAAHLNGTKNTYTIIYHYDTLKSTEEIDTTYTNIFPWYYMRNIRWEAINVKPILINTSDSITFLGDTGLVIFVLQNSIPITHSRYNNQENKQWLNPFQIYQLAYQQKPISAILANAIAEKEVRYLTGYAMNELQFLPYPSDNWGYQTSYQQDIIDRDMLETYKIGYLQNCISNIEERKYRFSNNGFFRDTLAGILSIAFALSVLLTVFRHSSLITFIASSLSGVLLSLLIGLIIALLRLAEYEAFSVVLACFGLLFLGTFTLAQLKKRSILAGVVLQLSLYVTFFIPLLIVGIHYSYINHLYPSYIDAYSFYYEQENLHYVLACLGGFVLFIGMLFLFYARLFRNWFALPEE